MKLHLAASVALVCTSVTPTLAQTNVDTTNKFSWSENCGFLNWRDAGSPAGAQGARIGFKILSGFVWGETIGWIDLGDGTPANGQQYANPTSGPVVGIPDFGVNRDPATNALSGFAWGENVGWVNFSGGAGQVIHARRDYPDGARHQCRGPGSGHAVGAHKVHLAMLTGVQPGLQTRLRGCQIGVGHPQVSEAKHARPIAHVADQCLQSRVRWHHGEGPAAAGAWRSLSPPRAGKS